MINDLPSVCLLEVCVFWERWQEQVCQNAVKTMSYLAMFSNQISSLHQTISYLSFGPQLFEVFVCYHVIYNGNWSRCCSRHFDLSYSKMLPSNHKCNNRANRPLTEKSLGSLSETREELEIPPFLLSLAREYIKILTSWRLWQTLRQKFRCTEVLAL